MIAILLVAVLTLAMVVAYEENQIASLNRELSSGTVSVSGERYYDVSVPLGLSNGTQVLFHGVTFTILSVPGESLLSTGKFAGSIWLSNGTLLNLNGKYVSMGVTGEANVSIVPTNRNLSAIYYVPIGLSIAFSDGTRVVHTNFNLNATYDKTNGLTDVWFTLLPVANPWFTRHGNTSVGFYVSSVPHDRPVDALTLYVSASS